MDLRACGNPLTLQFGTSQCMFTYCSTANLFIPSRRTPVTFSFRYLRAGAPCAAAFAGNGGGTSTLPLVFLIGVAVLCAVGVAANGGGTGEGWRKYQNLSITVFGQIELNPYRYIHHIYIRMDVHQWGRG